MPVSQHAVGSRLRRDPGCLELAAWNWLIGDPERIRSVGATDWATVTVQGRWYYTTSGDVTGASEARRPITSVAIIFIAVVTIDFFDDDRH